MNTVEFLQKELDSYEESFHKLGLNYWPVVKEVVEKTHRKEDDVIVDVEAIKRELRNRRDFLRELLRKAQEEE